MTRDVEDQVTTTTTTTRTITSNGVSNEVRVDGLTSGLTVGWTWDGQTLDHPLATITLNPEAAARITAALAGAKPGHTDRKTGYQVSHLPAEQRDGWEYAECIDSIGWYTRYTPGITKTAQFDVSEVVSVQKKEF